VTASLDVLGEGCSQFDHVGHHHEQANAEPGDEEGQSGADEAKEFDVFDHVEGLIRGHCGRYSIALDGCVLVKTMAS